MFDQGEESQKHLEYQTEIVTVVVEQSESEFDEIILNGDDPADE